MDALTGLKQIPDNSIDCCITSPPYWALRKYGVSVKWDNWEGELGLEPTIQLYIEHLLQIFDQVKRVLKKEGSCWVVISDTYGRGDRTHQTKQTVETNSERHIHMPPKTHFSKSLVMIPERFAIGMIDHGWILRAKPIWHKRNCMPSSAKDRPTVDYENVYFFVKSKRYAYETQYEPYQTTEKPRVMGIDRTNNFDYLSKYANTPYYGYGKKKYKENNVQNPSDVKRRILNSMKKNMPPIGGVKKAGGQNPTYSGNQPEWGKGRIMRAVWTINTQQFPEAHFAVFPEKLVERMLLWTCPAYICDKCNKPWTMEYSEKRINTRPGKNVLTGKSGTDEDPNAELHKSDLSKYRQQIIRNEAGYIKCECNTTTHSGIVLDPFLGSGTSALVALKMSRNFIGIEPKIEYVKMAYKRIDKYLHQGKL